MTTNLYDLNSNHMDNIVEPYVKYKRKSQEDKNKQIASIPSQERTFNESISFVRTSGPVKDFEEEQSAKAPGRPKFNEMCELLEQGKAKIIVCWQLNRLARNAVDGGRIIWLVQHYGIRIVTPSTAYGVKDILLMYVEFGMSNVFITDLQSSTKRGVDEKIIAGKAPIFAPVGYYNDITKPQGLRDILVDELRFPLVRKMWDLLLTMQFSPPKILEIATNEWGLRHRNGKPLSDSQMYAMFGSLFYAGLYTYKGEIHQGIHEVMITLEEYDKAQGILGRKGKPRLRKHQLPLTNLITCVCGSSITGDQRFRKTCPKCHHRYNYQNYDSCPKCKAEAPLSFCNITLYHCNRYLNSKCTQSGVSGRALEHQIDELLSTLIIPQEFIDWTMNVLRKDQQSDVSVRTTMLKNLQATQAGTTRRLDNLALKYFSDENRDGEILSDEEYKRLKSQFILEKKKIEEKIITLNQYQDEWLDNTEKLFSFAKQARGWFTKGAADEKRAIVAALGINFTLKNKILTLDLLKPIEKIQEARAIMIKESKSIVPHNQIDTSIQMPTFDPSIPVWGGRRVPPPLLPGPQPGALLLSYIHHVK